MDISSAHTHPKYSADSRWRYCIQFSLKKMTPLTWNDHSVMLSKFLNPWYRKSNETVTLFDFGLWKWNYVFTKFVIKPCSLSKQVSIWNGYERHTFHYHRMFTYLGILVTSFTVSSQSPMFIFIFITLGILQVCNQQVFCCFRWGSERINNMKVCEMCRYLQRVKFMQILLVYISCEYIILHAHVQATLLGVGWGKSHPPQLILRPWVLFSLF